MLRYNCPIRSGSNDSEHATLIKGARGKISSKKRVATFFFVANPKPHLIQVSNKTRPTTSSNSSSLRTSTRSAFKQRFRYSCGRTRLLCDAHLPLSRDISRTPGQSNAVLPIFREKSMAPGGGYANHSFFFELTQTFCLIDIWIQINCRMLKYKHKQIRV